MKKLALALCSGAIVLAACSGTDGTADDGDETSEDRTDASSDRGFVDGGTFAMALDSDPGALNPATSVQGSTNLLLSFAYDTLVYIGEDGELVPGLAESWETTPTEVTFTLASDATCSDGSAVTPETVVRSIEYVTNPETKSPLLGVLIPADLTAEADGEAGTVTIRTGEPNVFLLHSTVAMFIICGEGLDDPAMLDGETSGSGPFELVESVAGESYTLSVRDGYTWGPSGTTTADRGVPATVELQVLTDESTRANLLLSGDINAAAFGGADRARVEAAPEILTQLLAGGMNEFFFNQQDGLPGADPAVRQALTQALDLDELGMIYTQGTGIPATGMATLSPRPCRDVDSVTGHRPQVDVAAAEDALDAAGWTVGADGIRAKDGEPLTIRLLYNMDYGPGVEAGSEYQSAAWEDLGVDVDLRGVASGAYSEAIFGTGDWDVSMVPLGLSLPSQLIGYLSGPGVADGGSNFSNIANDEYDSLTAEAATVPVDEGGCEVWAAAESALFDSFDVVPVVEPTQLLASNGAEVFMPGGLAQGTMIKILED